MFLEKTVPRDQRKGWIEVIAGSMFSGKTEELLRRLKRARIAGMNVEIFKPRVDVRYSENNVVSHDANSIPSTPVDTAASIALLCSNVDVVGIDEAQFFDQGLPEVCNLLANQGIRVIVAGLDMDFKGIPFCPIPAFMSIAEYITKVHAICIHCGDLAHYSHRLNDSNQLLLLGETSTYEPLCPSCYHKINKKIKQ